MTEQKTTFSLLSLTSRSKKYFAKKFRSYDDVRARNCYFQSVSELLKTVLSDNVLGLKSLSWLINHMSSHLGPEKWQTIHQSPDNPLKNINLVIFATKHGKLKALEYLLCEDRTLFNLCSNSDGSPPKPSDVDDEKHNAVYYAIRSNNTKLLGTLIKKWPDEYFVKNMDELDELLSKAYKELKRKNVPLSTDIDVFVQSKLIDLRFFDEGVQQNSDVKTIINHILQRIELILDNIRFIVAEFFNSEVDERFLLVAEFIVKNIHTLKLQLKSTYNRLPWEEMEFCMVIFLRRYILDGSVNIFHRMVLNRKRLLGHIEAFAIVLASEKDTTAKCDPKKLRKSLAHKQRKSVIAAMIKTNPKLEDLFDDYSQLRDFESLEVIEHYIAMALSANSTKRDGRLLITRALQVAGEYMKNTLESPKLSEATSDLLLSQLPCDVRDVMSGLRNSLSHAESFALRKTVEEKGGPFFAKVQTDMARISSTINETQLKLKRDVMQSVWKKIAVSESEAEIRDICDLSNIPSELYLIQHLAEPSKRREGDLSTIRKLLAELSEQITDQSTVEQDMFIDIDSIIQYEIEESTSRPIDLKMELQVLTSKAFFFQINFPFDETTVSDLKVSAALAVQSYSENELRKQASMKSIVEKILPILMSFPEKNMARKILNFIQFELGDIKWISDFKDTLDIRETDGMRHRKTNSKLPEPENINNDLLLILDSLNGILRENGLIEYPVQNFHIYKRDSKLQAVVEMLMLDAMSILNMSRNSFTHNTFLLDSNFPVSIGKNLRNDLAHCNSLMGVLLKGDAISIAMNARKMVTENITCGDRKIDKIVRGDPLKTKVAHEQELAYVENQEAFFAALSASDLGEARRCISDGADVNGRSMNLRTALHFASMAPNLDAMEFVISLNAEISLEDMNGQSPLHLAAAFGRSSAIDFYVNRMKVHVDERDHCFKTPLHLAAANGHTGAILCLLKHGSSNVVTDWIHATPLYYAIMNNHFDASVILLETEEDVNRNQFGGGWTAIHIAAENGQLELLKILLAKKASVQVKTDRNCIPLHLASRNGHLEVVKTLLSRGSDVNALGIDGLTPLVSAVERGFEAVARVLLDHGARINTAHLKSYPLHMAADKGHLGTAKLLLENKVGVSTSTPIGETPLHYAAKSGQGTIVSLLIQHKASVNCTNYLGESPLHLSARQGHTETARILIEAKAIVDLRSDYDLTPLQVAALTGNTCVAELLLYHGADANLKVLGNMTALHLCCSMSHIDTVKLLLGNGADDRLMSAFGDTPFWLDRSFSKLAKVFIPEAALIKALGCSRRTALHLAAFEGNLEFVKFCMECNYDINATDNQGLTALHMATTDNHEDIVKILIDKGADVNRKDNKGKTALSVAVMKNYKNVVRILLGSGAAVLDETGEGPLYDAAYRGHKKVLELLLESSKCDINTRFEDGKTLLSLASMNDHQGVVKFLLNKGIEIDSKTTRTEETSLYFAAERGYFEIVELLLSKGANPNAATSAGDTPLHAAACSGDAEVFELLIKCGARMDARNSFQRSPLDVAVAKGRLQVLKQMKVEKKEDFTVLHIAAQAGQLDTVKYLVDNGADIHDKNDSGSKPIHIAAREGRKTVVEYFLDCGISIDDRGASDSTLLHFAAIGGHADLATCLIRRGVDINAQDSDGSTPVFIASVHGHKDVLTILLENSAYYDARNRFNLEPLDVAEHRRILVPLTSTHNLFVAVRSNRASQVKMAIKESAFVNAQSVDDSTPLHCCARKSYAGIVKILLERKADPNIRDNAGCVPLHYAAQCSNSEIVEDLLMSGAIYNTPSHSGKTPLDLAVDPCITDLLRLVDSTFENVQSGNCTVLTDLKQVNNMNTIKAVMRAKDRKGKTLVASAICSEFPKIEELKEVSQEDLLPCRLMAQESLQLEDFVGFINANRIILLKRTEIFGPDNPGVSDIHFKTATALCKQNRYVEALNILNEIFEKQKETQSADCKDCLKIKGFIAGVLHRQGKNEKAFIICDEVYRKQVEILGAKHPDVLNTQMSIAMILNARRKFMDALVINQEIFEESKAHLGEQDPITLIIQNNIAANYSGLRKHRLALKLYKDTWKKISEVLGPRHSDTLRTLQLIASELFMLNKRDEALRNYREVLNIQRSVLGPKHLDTLTTRDAMARVLLRKGACFEAYQIFNEVTVDRIAILGPHHPEIVSTLEIIKLLERQTTIREGSGSGQMLQRIRRNARISGSFSQDSLGRGAFYPDSDDVDIHGRTALHYAAHAGKEDEVSALLKTGAYPLLVSSKGNTPLHLAAAKGHVRIVANLLQHVERSYFADLTRFVGARTTLKGTTALHVAADLETAKLLLSYGADYEARDSTDRTPADLATDEGISGFLKAVGELFHDSERGHLALLDRIRGLDDAGKLAVTNARNGRGDTLLQVALRKKHVALAKHLGKLLEARSH